MILTFSNWKITKPSGTLGYQYDNLTRELVVQGDLPEGWTWDMLVSASGNSDTWPLALGDGQASITLTDDNLSVRGEYYLQLRGTNGDQVRHTNIIMAYNSRSLSGDGQWPTLPTEWIQAEKDIKELNAHPPVPGLNGYWLLWDLSSHSYQESDLPVPVGPAGPPNVLEIGTVETLPADQQATASITGESPAQKLSLGIPQGQPGKDGPANTLEIGTVETLEPGQAATAQIIGEAPNQTLSLGIPQGQTGKTGATPALEIGQVETLEPGEPATAELSGTPEKPVLSLGIPQGPPGQDGVQLNDNAVNTTEAWSSKKIVDTLCPSFSVSGNPVTCHPVEDYPLSAVVSLKPKQAGTGDPSPENVRAISGYDSVTVNVRGKNLLDYSGEITIPQDTYLYNYNSEEFITALNKLPRNTPLVMSANWSYVSEINTYKRISVVYGDNTYSNFNDGVSATIDDKEIEAAWLYAGGDKTQECIVSNIQFEAGSTPTPYEPYQPGTTATLTLPEIIYGGTVDAVMGVGSKTWGYIASYNGESLPGEWISDRDVYASGTTPTTGAQVAYKLATPEPFQATGNQALPAVAGLNTVYTDGDSLSVTGRQDLLYTLQTMQTQTTNLNRFIAEGGTQ